MARHRDVKCHAPSRPRYYSMIGLARARVGASVRRFANYVYTFKWRFAVARMGFHNDEMQTARRRWAVAPTIEFDFVVRISLAYT